MDAVKIVGIPGRGRWMEDLLGQVDSCMVEPVISDILVGVYPVVVIGEAFSVNYSVWVSYF